MPKGKSIPTKFGPEEDAIVNELQRRTGFSRSEIIRRCVRLARLEMERRNGEIGFLLEELAPGQMTQSLGTMKQSSRYDSSHMNEEPKKK